MSVLCIKHCTAKKKKKSSFKKMKINYILLHAVLIKFLNLRACQLWLRYEYSAFIQENGNGSYSSHALFIFPFFIIFL